jgi:ribose transport system substrate-binding protein
MPSPLTRRTLLGAAAALLPAAAAPAADPVAAATITPADGTTVGRARPGPWRIAFSDGYGATPWRRMCLAELRRAAAAHPREIAQLIVRDAGGYVGQQLADLGSLIRDRVDAILCIPAAADPIVPALADATARGIATVVLTLPVSGTAWNSYVGTDKAAKGAAMARWLTGTLGGHGRIVGLGGLPGNAYSQALWAGAQPVFTGGGIDVLRFAWANWDRTRARAVMAGLIGAFPVIDGAWCDGGQDAAGAEQALLAAGRQPVPVTGDDNNGLLKLYASLGIRYPGFRFGLLSEPTWQSVIALDTALRLLAGATVPKRQYVLPAMITNQTYTRFIRPNLPDDVLVDTTLDDATLRRIFG